MSDALNVDGPGHQSKVQCPRWKAGAEVPPFTCGNASVLYLRDVLHGSSDVSTFDGTVSDAVVIQIYFLIFGNESEVDSSMTEVGWPGFYRVIAFLCLGYRVDSNIQEVNRLQLTCTRPKSKYHKGGLVPQFKAALKRQGLASKQALLMTWDANPFTHRFKEPPALVVEGNGGGGGGGGSAGGETSTASAPPPKRAQNAALSVRAMRLEVRAFAAASVHRSFFSMSTEITTWHAERGSFPLEILEKIHRHVLRHELTPKEKEKLGRYMGQQQQLLKLRQEYDTLKASKEEQETLVAIAQTEVRVMSRQLEDADRKVEKAHADAEEHRTSVDLAMENMRKEHLKDLKAERASAAASISEIQGEMRGERSNNMENVTRLEAIIGDLEKQVRRAQDKARSDMASYQESVEKANEQTRKQHAKDINEERASGAYTISLLQGEVRGERAEHLEKITDLEAMITGLEKQVRQAQHYLRMNIKESDKSLAKMQSEMHRLDQSRAWSRVREEETKRARVERERDEARDEVLRQAAELRKRNHSTAAEKQELAHLRYQRKELRERVASYQVKSNRKFFEVEPLMEENQELHTQVEQLRAQLDAQTRSAEAEVNAIDLCLSRELSALEQIACPPYHLFYQSRGTKGGVMLSDEWSILTMSLSTFNIPSEGIQKAVVAIAEFFGLRLLLEKIKVHCRKQGSTKIITRHAVPGAYSSKQMLEVGGELSDLITYGEIAESKTFGFTFDGATINMMGIFGGGVCIQNQDGSTLRRMAFAEMMTRETVTNKIRKMRDFFARGKSCLEMLNHPLASECKFERASGATSDRGGADGKVSGQIEREIIESVKRDMGRKAWQKLDLDGRLIATVDAWGEADEVAEAWAQAKARHDDIELDRQAVDAAYKPTFFDALSESTQEIAAAIQLLGHLEYEALPSDKKVIYVALYCLEHALSNTLVAMDEGMDEVAREIIPGFMPDDKKKEKAFVEVSNSPGNKLILSFCKLFAPCSDKDWAKNFDFKGWEQLEYGTDSLSDLHAILGSRFGIFFTNPRSILRGWSKAAAYLKYLEAIQTFEGKLRWATLSGLGNEGLRANLIAKSLIARLVYWTWMKRMNEVEHPFDMATPLQDAAAAFETYAADPSALAEGRGQLFSDEMLPEPDDDYAPLMAELAADAALRANVILFLKAAFVKGRPQLLKHTEEYQPGGVAALNTAEARAAAAALPASSHQQEGDFGTLQSLMGTKGKARHQKVRSAVGHAKLTRNHILDRNSKVHSMSPEERRKYLALSKLMWAQRLQREGRTRKEIALKHAEGLKEYRDGLVAETRRKEAEADAERRELEVVPRVVTMKAAHHLGVNELKLQLKIRSKLDNLKLDNKAITVGGKREDLLSRLKACMLLADPTAADGYDATKPKGFYKGEGGAAAMEVEGEAAAGKEQEEVQEVEDEPGGSSSEVAAADGEALAACAVERIEMAEERDGETYYLLKWRSYDESDSTWVATSALEQYGAAALELVASFEAAHVEDNELEPDEYVIEKLIGRRYATRSSKLEYLVRWQGYEEDEDTWEEAEGLPLDLRQAYNASQRTSTRPARKTVDEPSADARVLPFPCGVFGCGKRYATKDELQLSSNGKELGCPGGPFGWCMLQCSSGRPKRG